MKEADGGPERPCCGGKDETRCKDFLGECVKGCERVVKEVAVAAESGEGVDEGEDSGHEWKCEEVVGKKGVGAGW